jgi:di/tricarboxylate transporter
MSVQLEALRPWTDWMAHAMEPLTTEMVLVLVVLAGAIALFVTEVVRIDVAAILIMVVVGVAGLVPPSDVFAGFASNAVVSIIAVMILGAALDRVGIMRSVAAAILRVSGTTERRITAAIGTAVGLPSAFMQNIGAAALFLPVVERISERTGVAASRLLMPMGFTAILGGTLTLVASGPLILLNDLLAASSANLDIPIEPYRLFDPLPIGIALLVTGITLFVVAGRWLLPDASAVDDGSGLAGIDERYGLRATHACARVPAHSPLVGWSIEDAEATVEVVLITAIRTDADLQVAPARDAVIAPGSVVGLRATPDDLATFVERFDLEPTRDESILTLLDSEDRLTVEAVVRPGGPADGALVRDLRLRAERRVTLLALHHQGAVAAERLRDQRLAGGDVLVLSGPFDAIRALNGADLVLLDDDLREPPRTAKRWWALGSFVVAIGLVIATDLPLPLALMVGAAGVLLSQTMTPDEAYRAVSWKTVFLLAALIPLGQAVEESGTAAWLASGIITASAGLPAWAILLVIGVLGTVFTLVVSNVGATVLLVPLAVNVAVGVGADPAMFGLMVAIVASNAFLLPTHQVNALMMGPGNYQVRDFLRAGTAMSIVFLAVATPMVLLVG